MGRGFSSKSSEDEGSFQLHFSLPAQSPYLFRAGRSRGGFLILFAFSSQEDSVSFKFCLTSHVFSVLLEEDGITERSGEGLSREESFKKRGVSNLSLFKYRTQVQVLLCGLGVKKKKTSF
jgi:hypothetical protein